MAQQIAQAGYVTDVSDGWIALELEGHPGLAGRTVGAVTHELPDSQPEEIPPIAEFDAAAGAGKRGKLRRKLLPRPGGK